MLTQYRLPVLILFVSLCVIGGALFLQYVEGLVPCELCLKERYPWYAAIVISLALIIARPPTLARPACLFFTLLFAGAGAFGLYHVGVELHLIAGPTTCTGGSNLSGLSPADAVKALLATPTVRCDEVQWRFAGISLAGWNACLSFLMAATSLGAFLLPARAGRLMSMRKGL
jgi:disulfide bond formation protein DsbB